MNEELLFAALTLSRGYNTTLASLGAACLGATAGMVGAFVLLRKRSLVSDALSHATLPGICCAFIASVLLGSDERNLVFLLLGSTCSAWLGLLAIEWLARDERLGEDTAIGAVLSVWFGLGILLLTVIQTMESGARAGLANILLGAVAGMTLGESLLLIGTGSVIMIVAMVLRRIFLVIAFDRLFACTSGLNAHRFDLALMALVVALTIVGLKIVGLVLIVALMIIPPVTARFWTDRAERMILLAILLGAVSCHVGIAISSAGPNLPSGPIIVLVSFTAFAFSFVFAPRRGLFAQMMQRVRFRRRLRYEGKSRKGFTG